MHITPAYFAQTGVATPEQLAIAVPHTPAFKLSTRLVLIFGVEGQPRGSGAAVARIYTHRCVVPASPLPQTGNFALAAVVDREETLTVRFAVSIVAYRCTENNGETVHKA